LGGYHHGQGEKWERRDSEQASELYQTFNPGFAFDYRFLDQTYQRNTPLKKESPYCHVIFAGLAIIISCLGLFGLAASAPNED